MGQIDRASTRSYGTFTNDVGDRQNEIDIGSFSDILFIFPAPYAATSIKIMAYHGSLDEPAGPGDNQWYEIASIVPTAGGVVKLPDICFAADRVRLVTNNAGSNAQVVWMMMKG